MMTSETRPAQATEAYVWIWLPGRTEPVVAGRLDTAGPNLVFSYGRSYLARDDAIPVHSPELPLQRGPLPLLDGLSIPGCIRDAAPDAWGRRVIVNRLFGATGADAGAIELDEITYLLQSGSDRIGALDFQASPTDYVARRTDTATLEGLMTAADKVEQGIPLEPALDAAMLHGSAIGGARPKAMLESDDRKFIAKFSSSGDLYNVVKAEFVAMRLAAATGIDTAQVALRHAAGRDVLLIERFDRTRAGAGWQRRAMVSALTLLELDEMMARYASYEKLATIVRHRFGDPKSALRELFARLTFNILCGNTDDHARNHAAFWDGRELTLTPAYDICPQGRSGNQAGQAMRILDERNDSRIVLCLEAAALYLLTDQEALALVAHQIAAIRENWDAICDEADLSEIDRRQLWRRQFLNPYIFQGAPDSLSAGLQ
jgi:serine/threonine-protein kinase HipA